MKDESHDQERRPAAYPHTAPSELESINTLKYLLDTTYIKPIIRELDKYPNSDGILEITDKEQFPIGKIDVQVKTLPVKNYDQPSHPLDDSFIAYCEQSVLPVIIILVNNRDKIAYWRHLDEAAIAEYLKNKKGNTYSLSVPISNFIDKINSDYITAWSIIAKSVKEKIRSHDALSQETKLLQEQVTLLETKLQNPTQLPLPFIKDVHAFLDYYNYILDIEFPTVKKYLYPNYWKIGIGIMSYLPNDIKYILYPVPFKKDQTLVKEVRATDYDDFLKEMYDGNVLVVAHMGQENRFKVAPRAYAYECLDDSIMRIAGKKNFPVNDLFLANEYLTSFIDHFQEYFGLGEGLDSYNLSELKHLLYSILPMHFATTWTYADWVETSNMSIDSYSTWRSSPQHLKALQKAEQNVKSGFVPKVKVTITSERYDINLIYHYIEVLENAGKVTTQRIYQRVQYDKKIIGVDFWKSWHVDVLWQNTQLFFNHYYHLYDLYIDTHFPNIKHTLKMISDEESTIVILFRSDTKRAWRPYLEIYELRPKEYTKRKLYFFEESDSKNPINRRDMLNEGPKFWDIEGKTYQLMHMHVQVLDFMFKDSPIYSLINDELTKKLQEFFREKIKDKLFEKTIIH